MATQALGPEKESEKGTSFLDFKMKRRRLSEIVGNNVQQQLDVDNQSTVSSESGYGSLTERQNGGKSSPKDLFEDGSECEMAEVKSDKRTEEGKESSEPQKTNTLFLPPPYYCDNTNVHIGVAYVSFEANSKNLSDRGDGLKVGLIPVMDNMLPFDLKRLAGIKNQSFPKEAQPLFMTTMPTGFFMTNSGPTPVTAGLEIKVSDSVAHKHKLSTDEVVKTCASKKMTMVKESETEFIDHYTNGMFEYLGHLGGLKTKGAEVKHAERSNCDNVAVQEASNAKYDNKYPMVCGICNDKATGLHYGIITCEG